jgi:hypothetical protein
MSPDDAGDDREYPCLVRVTDGHDAVFSTHVRLHSIILHTTSSNLLIHNLGPLIRRRSLPHRLWHPPQKRVFYHAPKTGQETRENESRSCCRAKETRHGGHHT